MVSSELIVNQTHTRLQKQISKKETLQAEAETELLLPNGSTSGMS